MERVGEGKCRLLARHLFVLEIAAGIGCEGGFVSVAKEMLLASIAIAKRKAGLLARWGSGGLKFVFDCIIFSCVVE